MRHNPERVRQPSNPVRVQNASNMRSPGFSFLEPWAEISERLRRIFKLNQYRPLGLCGLIIFADKFTAEAQRTQRLRRVILWSAAAGWPHSKEVHG